MISDNPTGYIGVLNNCILGFYRKKDFKETGKYLQMIDNIKVKKKIATIDNLKETIFARGGVIKIKLAIEYYNSQKAEETIQHIIDNLNTYEMQFPIALRFVYYMNLALYHFIYKKYNDALFWLEKVLNHKNEKIRLDIYIDALIVQLFIHYELGNIVLVESIINSLKFQAKKTIMLIFYKRK